jgi:hypothetical protein
MKKATLIPGLLMLLLLLPAWVRAQDTEPEESDLGWPLVIEVERGTIVIYQPQVDTMTKINLEARAAVAATPAGDSEPQFGAIWFTSRIQTDTDARVVEFTDIEVTAAKFPTIDDDDVERLTDFVEAEIPKFDLTMSLDRFLADLEVLGDRTEDVLVHDPPRIIYTQEPSVLILFDGDPILSPVEGTELEYVVNTPFLILKEKKDFYLMGGDQWWKSKDALGPWNPIDEPSRTVGEVAEQMVEPPPDSEPLDAEEESGELVVPRVYVSTEPAELIESAGPADWVPIGDTNLLFMANTESDVLMSLLSQEYHLLLSGRWYSSSSLSDGPWKHVAPDALPDDFAKIPPDSTYEHLLASVPGTVQAKEAVLESEIPQTAKVSRDEVTLDVTYDGQPQFETIEDTEMQYAVNTEKAVFLVDGRYYCCDDAIWFVADAPTGPWAICDDVPDVIYTIPPANPHYNVKYVYVYESTPEVVYVGYTAGYMGCYHYNGCVVYGTGWVYPYWWYTWYYPRPVTYGFHVRWNPYTGWGFGFSFGYGGWFRVGFRGWWGPRAYHYGYRHGFHHGYRAGYRHGARAGYRAGYRAAQRNDMKRNVYDRGRDGVRTSDRAVATDRARDRSTRDDRSRDRAAQDPSRTRDGTGDRAGTRDGERTQDRTATDRSKPKNDVYTDRDGNVYRRGEDGNWQRRDESGWSSTDRAGSDRSQDRQQQDRQQQDRAQQDRSQRQDRGTQDLNRDSRSRQRGQERSHSYNSRRGGGGSRSGARRGGGRRG